MNQPRDSAFPINARQAVKLGLVFMVAAALFVGWAFYWVRTQGQVDAAHDYVEWWYAESPELSAAEAAQAWDVLRDGLGDTLDRLTPEDRALPYVTLAKKYINEGKYSEALLMYENLSSISPRVRLSDMLYLAAMAGEKEWLQRSLADGRLPADEAWNCLGQVATAWSDRDGGKVLALTETQGRSAGLQDSLGKTELESWVRLFRAHALISQGRDQDALKELVQVVPYLKQMTTSVPLRTDIMIVAAKTAEKAGDREGALAAARVAWDAIDVDNKSLVALKAEVKQMIQRLQGN